MGRGESVMREGGRGGGEREKGSEREGVIVEMQEGRQAEGECGEERFDLGPGRAVESLKHGACRDDAADNGNDGAAIEDVAVVALVDEAGREKLILGSGYVAVAPGLHSAILEDGHQKVIEHVGPAKRGRTVSCPPKMPSSAPAPAQQCTRCLLVGCSRGSR